MDQPQFLCIFLVCALALLGLYTLFLQLKCSAPFNLKLLHLLKGCITVGAQTYKII